MMTMADVLSLVDRLGVPVAVLVALGLAIRKCAIWVAPRIDKVVDAHVGFVNSVEKQVERQTDIIKAQSETTKAIAESQDQHGKWIEDLHNKQFPPSASVVINGPATVNTQKRTDPDQTIVVQNNSPP